MLITAVSRMVVEKVHTTIPKGIVGGFDFTVFQKISNSGTRGQGRNLRVLKESNKK